MREAPFQLVRDSAEPGDGLTLDGYAAVFGVETVVNSWEGRFTEVLAKGSMAESFSSNPPIIQFNHGRDSLYGSLPIASLVSATEDTHPILAPFGGAHIIARIFDNYLTVPLRQAIKSNAIKGMSFRFEVLPGGESWTLADGTPITSDVALVRELEKSWDPMVPDSELPIRTLKRLLVAECGPVTWPQYTQTSVSVRDGIAESERRKLLARSWSRSVDEAALILRCMQRDIAARRERVAHYPAGYDR